MNVVGIHHGHDSACSVVRNGEIIADVQEERFNRNKHSANVPVQSLAYCIEAAGVRSINEFDRIAIGWRNTPSQLAALLGLPLKGGARMALKKALHNAGMEIGTFKERPPLYMKDHRVLDPRKVINVEHHLAHAASAHYTRETADRCLVFTVDGAGDGVSTAVWEAEGNQIKPLQKLYRDAAIGHAYSVVTEALHWWHGDGEGKTMGLAPYGEADKCRGVLDHLFPIIEGTEIREARDLGQYYYWKENGSVQFHFPIAREIERLCQQFGKENIAAEAQRKLEECLTSYVFGWLDRTGIKRAAFSGGVFLNVKLNQRIWYNRGKRLIEQHIFPNCGDSGLAAGAALYAYYLDHPFTGTALRTLYWGPEYSAERIQADLELRHLPYGVVSDPSVAAAELLSQGKIVAWFQGRMESGPRALGHRSILMSPTRPENKDIINARVKFREAFRPFCPSMLYEKAEEYLVDPRDEHFMITSFDVKDEKRALMPAIVHADGTARPQLVTREMDEAYWRLIKEFGDRTGVYCVLNTSMNIMGEPIVCTPSEAIRCFYDTGLDALIMDRFVLVKDPNPPTSQTVSQPITVSL